MKEKFENSNQLCLCGSKKIYNECCIKKIDPYTSEKCHKNFLYELQKYRKNFQRTCLHPNKEDCDNKIHAHTISKAAVLELISDKGEVFMPVVYEITGEFQLKSLGIGSKATKFYCFCKKHDSLFYPIDKINTILDTKSIFLYAYRNFSCTYYKLYRELECFKKIVLKFNITKNPPLFLHNESLKSQFEILKWYKNKFDNALVETQYNLFESEIVTLDYKTYVAAATCLCLEYDLFGNHITYNNGELPLIFVSIIPHEKETKIIFSWFKEDNHVYDFFKEQINLFPINLILKYLNNVIPLSCENMVLGPALWDKWTENARNEFQKSCKEQLKNPQKRNDSKIYFNEHEYNIFLKI